MAQALGCGPRPRPRRCSVSSRQYRVAFRAAPQLQLLWGPQIGTRSCNSIICARCPLSAFPNCHSPRAASGTKELLTILVNSRSERPRGGYIPQSFVYRAARCHRAYRANGPLRRSLPAFLLTVLATMLASWYLAVLGLGLVVVSLLRRHLFHPLKQFPGPFWAAYTDLWRVYHLSTRRFPQTLVQLHAQYGPVVRIAPNDLSFDGKATIEEIYKSGRRFIKSDFYDGFTTFHPNLFGTRDEEVSPIIHTLRL